MKSLMSSREILYISTTKSFTVWFGSLLEFNLIHLTIRTFDMNLRPWLW